MSPMLEGTCLYCGGWHLETICPKIEEIEYFPGGGVKRVKLRGWETDVPKTSLPKPPRENEGNK